MMKPHVNELCSLLCTLKSSLDYLLGRSDKGHHRPVRPLAHIHVKHLPSSTGNGSHNRIYDSPVTPFAEIRHTLDYPFHETKNPPNRERVCFLYLERIL